MSKEDMELRQERFLKLGEIWALLRPSITLEEESMVMGAYFIAAENERSLALDLYDYQELNAFEGVIIDLAYKYGILDEAESIISR